MKFKGVYERDKKCITTFTAAMNGQKEVDTKEVCLDDPQVNWLIGEGYHSQLLEDIELLDGAGQELDMDLVRPLLSILDIQPSHL